MIVIGLDPHPKTHTVAALDETGARQAVLTVPNTPEGLEQLHALAKPFESRVWAVEGASNRFIAAFVAQLLARDERVVHIPPGLTSQYRARRGRKKNDVVDAENAARVLLANPELPAFSTSQQRQDLLDLTHTQRRVSQQLKANRAGLNALETRSPVREALTRIVEVLENQLDALEKQLRALVKACLPQLLDLTGVGPVVAGLFLAEVGDAQRFANQDCFASYCGAAPVERGSGQNRRMQVNVGGNRRLNWALHIVAIVRLRYDGGHSRALVDKLKTRGKTDRAALRVLKTYIARELFHVLRQEAAAGEASAAS